MRQALTGSPDSRSSSQRLKLDMTQRVALGLRALWGYKQEVWRERQQQEEEQVLVQKKQKKAGVDATRSLLQLYNYSCSGVGAHAAPEALIGRFENIPIFISSLPVHWHRIDDCLQRVVRAWSSTLDADADYSFITVPEREKMVRPLGPSITCCVLAAS